MLLDSIDRQILNAHRTGETTFSGARMELHLATLNLKREMAKTPPFKAIEKLENYLSNLVNRVIKKK